MHPQRKKAVDESRTPQMPGQPPKEVSIEMVERWLKDDLQKAQTTMWMIWNDPELLRLVAKKFKEKMEQDASKLVAEAIQEQKSQPKHD